MACQLCTNTLPIGNTWATPGLTDNSPTSCLFECTYHSTWPTGACSGLSVATYIPTNAPGKQLV